MKILMHVNQVIWYKENIGTMWETSHRCCTMKVIHKEVNARRRFDSSGLWVKYSSLLEIKKWNETCGFLQESKAKESLVFCQNCHKEINSCLRNVGKRVKLCTWFVSSPKLLWVNKLYFFLKTRNLLKCAKFWQERKAIDLV